MAKAQKAKVKSPSAYPSRRPKQKGKVKKAVNYKPAISFMRTQLPLSMLREAEAERLQTQGVEPRIARNVAAWRSQHKVL